MTSYQMDTTRVKPQREIRLSKQGALLACGPSRYEEVQQYIEMFGAPLSQLTGAGVLTFSDPVFELVLLVETREIDWCGRCDQSLDDCHCAF